MILARSEKRVVILIAAIAVLVLLAAVPAGVAAAASTTIFEDDFESGNLNKWDNTGGLVAVTSTPAPPWGGNYTRFSGNATINRSWITAGIDTTCMKNICLSFARRTYHLNATPAPAEAFVVQFYNGTDWEFIGGYSDNRLWDNDSFCPLPATADDNPDFKIRFALANADPGEYAFLDNVTVTGEPMLPAIAVNKTVWNGTAWVKAHTAKINDTLQFRSIIKNTGNVNLTQIRFWDILDCSLRYQKFSLKINDTPVCIYDSPSFRFKPHVLHPDDSEWIGNPIWKNFTELYPPWDYRRQIVDWTDTNHDGNVSACDQIELVMDGIPLDGIPLSGGLGIDIDSVVDDGGDWYHVDRVPYTLVLYNESWSCRTTKYFDSEDDWGAVDLSDPINSTWFYLCGCKDRYTLLDWRDLECSSGLNIGDNVTLRNERTGEVITGVVSEDVVIDLVVSREYEIDEYLGPPTFGSVMELFILEPNQTITIKYNATVVKCGVDNNTFVAKGIGCGDNWTYSEPAVVTITVPCPSGDAADAIPVIKDLFTVGEPVYALGRDFAPNKSVDIYITPVRTWAFGDNISDYKIVGPVSVVTDANGSIGINPKVLMWPDPVPGLYHMVFDDPDGIYEPGVDLYDLFEVRGLAVPLITPLGLVALIGLLSVIATSTLIRRKRR